MNSRSDYLMFPMNSKRGNNRNAKRPSAAGRSQSFYPPRGNNPKTVRKLQLKDKSKKAPRARATRAQHLFSPLHPSLIPTVISSGIAFPYVGLRRLTLSVEPTNRTLVAVSNFGTSGSIMSMIQTTLVGGVISVTKTCYHIPTLGVADSAGGPTSSRAMKGGLSIVNTTQLLQQGGRVFHLHGTARLKLPASASLSSPNDWDTFMTDVVAFPATKSLGGHQFVNPREYSCSVIDNTRYEDFDQFVAPLSVDDFWAHITVWPGLVTLYDRPMSTIWIVFDPPPVTQTYTLSARAAYYTRWSATQIVGQSSRPIPTAPASTLNRAHEVANVLAANSHTMLDIGLGALGGAAGSVAAGAGYLANASRGLALEAGEMAMPLLALA